MKSVLSPEVLPSGDRSLPPAYDLLLPLSRLDALLADAVRTDNWLDAYLFAAAMNQIAQDYLHEDIGFVGAVGDRLLAGGGAARAAAGRSAEAALAVAQDLRSLRRSMRETLAWQRELAACVGELARVVCAPEGNREQAQPELEAALKRMLAVVDCLPARLREQTARLPACFQAFDLDVPDVVELTARFVEAHPDRSRPLVVAGVRTAGSYLAPLCSAVLESDGYTDVRVLTLRPRQPLLAQERELVRRVARAGGLTLLIDDPPASGRTVAKAAGQIAGLGFPRESIVLLLPLFGDPLSLAESLWRYPSVLLPAGEWSIDAKLTPDAVSRVLARLLPVGRDVMEVEAVQLPSRGWQRGHRRALFRVGSTGKRGLQPVLVLVEGVGIGYFGRQTLAVAERLPDHVPEIFGLEAGCLYRTWLPEEARVCPPGSEPDDAVVRAVTGYVADRKRALPVAEDRSVGEFGAAPVWEVVSSILSRTFGRGAPAARLLLVDALAKQLLRVARPSVIDGATSLSNWFSDESDQERVVKVEFAGRSFWNLGLLCYDAVFDLAGAALSSGDDATAERLRSTYTELVGEPIGDERWLLYELAQFWGRLRTRPEESVEVERGQARALRRYLARLYLSDLTPAREGPLCALDLDGVLETEHLGFPGMTAGGATALRALVCHGYRPILVSGRSAGDVQERCRSYGLAGGVAEYGAVVYATARDERRVLLSEAERSTLSVARDVLRARPGVRLDDAYRYAVRAFVVDPEGRRRPLHPATVRAVLDEVGSSAVAVVAGESQTDFTAAGVDKGIGTRALDRLLAPSGNGSPKPVALAVGDTAADLPMLREATLRFAPAHADARLSQEGIERLRAPYQAGLALAVGRLIGHEPGGCPTCRAPRLSAESDLLVALLSASEAGRIQLARRFIRLRRRAPLPTTPPG